MGPMIKRIKSNNTKKLLQTIAKQFGCEEKSFISALKDFVFSQNRDKINICRQMPVIELQDRVKVNSAGIYFCKEESEGIRLSMEGSWLVAPFAQRNILDICKEDALKWMAGKDIKGRFSGFDRYVIISYVGHILGCGKLTKKGDVVKNFVPKERRIESDMPFPE